MITKRRAALAALSTALAVITVTPAIHAAWITLETPALPASPGYQDRNFADGNGFFSNGAFFNNAIGEFDTWAGFALSRVTNNTTPGFTNQYSAWPGSGAPNPEGGGNSVQYAVGYMDPNTATPLITLPAGERPVSISIANTTYAALSMRDGDDFTDPFGGPSSTEPDWFRLRITGLDASDHELNFVDFYLADYRFSDSEFDYIVDAWTTVDLSGLDPATSKLRFNLASSDMTGPWINTPTYFAADNLQTVPEPASAGLLLLGFCGVAARRRRA